MGEKIPQRFRWKDDEGGQWHYGVCMKAREGLHMWTILLCGSNGHASFDADPWEILGQLIGDVHEFEWVDNDYGWHE